MQNNMVEGGGGAVAAGKKIGAGNEGESIEKQIASKSG